MMANPARQGKSFGSSSDLERARLLVPDARTASERSGGSTPLRLEVVDDQLGTRLRSTQCLRAVDGLFARKVECFLVTSAAADNPDVPEGGDFVDHRIRRGTIDGFHCGLQAGYGIVKLQVRFPCRP
jgi:hypothetical protein